MFDTKELTEKKTGLKLMYAKQMEVGKTYFNGYWSKTFKVLEIKPHEIWDKVYVVEWEGGRITAHSTAFDTKNDFEVI